MEQITDYPEVKRLDLLARENERVHGVLGQYLETRDADQLAKQLFDWAVELDNIADEIKNHPGIEEKYTYDGILFKRKNSGEFCKMRDGLNFLKMLDEKNLQNLLSSNKEGGKDVLFSWLFNDYIKPTRWRLESLRERGDIDITTSEEKREIVEEMSKIPTESSVPDEFFSPYEEQMKESQ